MIDLNHFLVLFITLNSLLNDSEEMERKSPKTAKISMLLLHIDKKERVERMLMMEEILETAIPRNFEKIGGSSIRFGPVRGVVTCENGV